MPLHCNGRGGGGANRFPLNLYLVMVLPLVSVGKLQRRWYHLLYTRSD